MSQSIQLQVTQVGLEQSIAAAMKRVGSSSQINLGTSSKQINALSQPLGRITGQADEFSKSMAAANARVLAFGASAGIIAGVSKAMSGLLSSTIKVEKSLVEISTVLNKTGSELDKFGQDIFNVAKNTGKSFDEVAKGALELARQGLDAEDTLIRLNDALILSRLSGLDAAQSVEGLTAAFNSFKSSGITTAEILNKVVAAAQKYSVSEKDIIEGLKRSASVANLAGVSFEELAAVITAVQEKTARGGAVIGNAFKTIFSRIQDKAVLSDLQDMRVGVTDLQGDVLPALKILENLAKKMEGFSQIEQADIAKKLGGVYQLDKLLAALSDLSDEASVTTGALKVMGEAGDSAYKKNAILNETLAALLNKVAVSAEQLGAKLGEIGVTDNLKNVLGFFNSLLEGIQKILGEESGLGNLVRGLVKGLGSFLAGPGLALFGGIILKLSKDLVQFGFASLKAFFGIGKAAKEVQNVEGAISQILSKNVNLQQQLFALEGNRAGQLRLITGALVEQEAVLRRSANISSGLATPLYNVGGRAKSSGLRIGNSAGGYMPAVAQESKSIQKGVGGARAGDKPIVMPNFNFGDGKKGTMVAHTGEYIVPNFNGSGGSAVFNRRMVQSMGLPSGAKKIGAAGGFIPNFARGTGSGPAELLQSIGAKSIQDLEQYRVLKNGKPTQAFDIGGNIVRESTVSNVLKPLGKIYDANSDPKTIMLIPQTAPYAASGLRTFFTKKKEVGGRVYDSFDGGYAGLDPELKSGGLKENSRFQKLSNIDDEMNEALASAASRILRSVSPDIKTFPKSLDKDNIGQYLEAGGAGALGSIRGALFESVINIITGSIKDVKQGTLDVSFGAGNNRLALEELFGVEGKNIQYADFKNSLGQKDKFIDQVMKNFPNRASGGYIPSFADPLREAIGREMAAGVPTSQIYIDKSSSLKNAANPMGLMVANRRDEPAGGFQGISRARREGANPMMYGAAGGFVPNYAAGGGDPDLTPYAGKTVAKATDQIQQELIDILTKIKEKYKQQLQDLQKNNQLIADRQSLEEKAIQAERDSLAQRLKQFRNIQKTPNLSATDKINIGIEQGAIVAKKNEINQRENVLNQERSTPNPITPRIIVSNKIKEDKQAKLDISNLIAAINKSGAKSLTNPLGKVRDSNSGGNRDVLGTLFAVQGAMVALTGATDGATNGFAKFANSLGTVASSVSTVVFAGQGLSQAFGGAATKAGEIVGKLGTIGAIGIGLYSAFNEYAKYVDSANPAMQKAAEASLKLAEAANKASVNLNTLNPVQKRRVEQDASDLIAGARKVKQGPFGEQRAAIGGISSQLNNDLQSGISQGLAVGVGYDQIYKEFNKYAESNAEVTSEEAESLLKFITERVNKISKEGSTSEAIKFLKDPKRSKLSAEDLASGFGVEEQLQEFFKKAGISDKKILDENVKVAQKGLGDESKQKTSEEEAAVSNINLELSKSQLKNAIELAVQKSRINDALDKELRSSQILNNLSEKQTDDLNYRIQLRDEERGLADQTKGFILDQLSQLKDIAAAEEVSKELQEELSKLTDKELNEKGKVEGIIKKINAQLSLNNTYSEATDEQNKDILKGFFDQFNIKKKGIELDKEALDATKETRDELNKILNIRNSISSKALFQNDIALLRTQANNQKRIAEIERSKTGASESQIRGAQKEIAGIQLSEAQTKAVADYNKELINQRKTLLELAKLKTPEAVNLVSELLGNASNPQQLKEAANKIPTSNLNQEDIQAFNNAITAMSEAFENLEVSSGMSIAAAEEQEKLAGAVPPVISALEMFRRSLLDSSQIIDQKIEDIKLQQLTSISGKELLQGNYDIETLNQQRGQTKEKAARIARERQNKGLGQLFAEEYTKTDEERALNINQAIVDGSVQFKNNMIEGIMGAVEGTSSLKDGLRSAAYEFVKMINQKMMSNLADKLVGGNVQSGTGQTSGGLAGFFSNMFASGGKVTGGSGSKDDVPAMLMGGEYVVNKKAVSKYGPKFLEAINSGTLNGYAKGGKVQRGPQGNFYAPGTFGQGAIEGKRNLLDFATQTGTSGKFDQMINESGYQSIALEPESSRLSVSGMRNSPMFDATQSAKGQAFDLYLQQYNAEREAKKQAKEQKKALIKQVGMLALSAALGPVINAAASGFGAAFQGASGQGFMSQVGAGFKGIVSGGTVGNQQVGGLSNLFSSAGKAFSGDFAGAANQFKMSQIGNGNQLSDLYKSDPKFASYIDSMGGINTSGAPVATNIIPEAGRFSATRPNAYVPSGTARSGSRIVQSANVNEAIFPELTESNLSLAGAELNRRKDIYGILTNELKIPPQTASWMIKNNNNEQIQKIIDSYGQVNSSRIQTLMRTNRAAGGMIPSTSGIDTVPAMLSGGEFVMNRSAVQSIGAPNLQSMNSGGTSITSEETSKELNEKLLAKLDELIGASGSTGNITINVAPSGQTSQENSQDPSASRQQLARQIKDAVLQIINDEKRIGGTLRR